MSAAEVSHRDPLADAVEAVERALALEQPGRPLHVVDDAGAVRLLDAAADPAWARPLDGLGLGAVERAILLVVVAPELSRQAAELTSGLGHDPSCTWPTVDLLVHLLRGAHAPSEVRGALGATSPMVAEGLVVVAQPSGASSLLATIRPATLLVERLLGMPLTVHPAIRRRPRRDRAALAGTLDDAVLTDLCPLIPDRPRAGIGNGVRRPWGGGPLVVVGDAAAALAVADHVAGAGESVVEVHLDEVGPAERRGLLCHATLLAALTSAVTVVLGASPADLDSAGSAVVQLDEAPEGDHRVIVAGEPGVAARRRGWLAALCPTGTAAHLDADDLDALASRYHLRRNQIDAVVTAMARRGTVDFAALAEACGTLLSRDLDELTTRVHRRAGWDDLVVGPVLLADLRHAATAIRHRHTVAALGVAHRRADAPAGAVVMFAGPSGTGKTLAASVIATELSCALHRVDLASVVSKYIGETERHLERVFTAAERAGALLLFDEADAIFAKRGEVREARDRYANLETSYLLQRIEQHDGGVILTTNARHHLDPAFQRRFAAIIQFGEPAEAERRRLWDVLLGDAPRHADLDLDRLTHAADVTGGEIAAVLLDAATTAIDAGTAIDAATVDAALARLQQRRGR